MSLSLSVLSRLQYQHEAVRELTSGMEEATLRIRSNPEKWSAFENIVHLVAYQPSFLNRISLILDQDNPHFERYVAQNDPLFYEYLQKPLPELLTILNNDRMAIVDMLSDLSEAELARIGTHPFFGEFSLAGWTEFFLLHEGHHLWTLFQLLMAGRGPAK